MGPLSYEKRESPVFLGMQYGHMNREYSEAKAEQIDGEVYRIVTSGYELAKKILSEKSDILERMAQALLEYESIDANEVEMLVAGGAVSELSKSRSLRKEKLEAERAISPQTETPAPSTVQTTPLAGNAGPFTA